MLISRTYRLVAPAVVTTLAFSTFVVFTRDDTAMPLNVAAPPSSTAAPDLVRPDPLIPVPSPRAPDPRASTRFSAQVDQAPGLTPVVATAPPGRQASPSSTKVRSRAGTSTTRAKAPAPTRPRRFRAPTTEPAPTAAPPSEPAPTPMPTRDPRKHHREHHREHHEDRFDYSSEKLGQHMRLVEQQSAELGSAVGTES